MSSPIKPVAPWIGGKRNLSKEIIKRIELVPHDLYAEPSSGWAASSSAGRIGRGSK